jgi:hypothetical protein
VWRETPVFGPNEAHTGLRVGTFVSDDLVAEVGAHFAT